MKIVDRPQLRLTAILVFAVLAGLAACAPDDVTISEDGWTFRAAAGWVVRESARRGDYEAVRQQP